MTILLYLYFHLPIYFYQTTIKMEILYFLLNCVYFPALVTLHILIFNTKYNRLIKYNVLLEINHMSAHKIIKISSTFTRWAVFVPHEASK